MGSEMDSGSDRQDWVSDREIKSERMRVKQIEMDSDETKAEQIVDRDEIWISGSGKMRMVDDERMMIRIKRILLYLMSSCSCCCVVGC